MPLIQFTNLNKYGTLRKRIMYTPTMPFRFNPKGLGPFVSVTIFKYRYEHYIPPTLFNANDGKRYILPTWQEVLPETTISDIEWVKMILTDEVKTKVKEKIEENTFKFESKSDPGSFYTVTKKGDKYKCTCPGSFRAFDKECKHIKQIKNG